jgi:cytoskeletal protein CcmA (bactofilin family)
MWKRENESMPPTPGSAPAPVPSPRRENETPTPRASEPSTSGGRAVIGAATVVRGEISGEEDLLVEGRVEGKIALSQNAVTVGAKGQLAAEVHARIVMIDGEVDGDLTAEEQIVLRKSGRVQGDLTAPRVTIEDGARFKGSIDMEPRKAVKAPRPANATAREGKPAASPSGKDDTLAATLTASSSSRVGS